MKIVSPESSDLGRDAKELAEIKKTNPCHMRRSGDRHDTGDSDADESEKKD